MVGKCKFCSRIFIRDIDHARKIENYFKVTNKGIEGTLISMLMNRMQNLLSWIYIIWFMILARLKTSASYLSKLPITLGLYTLFLQINFRAFLNALSDAANFVTGNYLLEHEI